MTIGIFTITAAIVTMPATNMFSGQSNPGGRRPRRPGAQRRCLSD
jgi:hypothetical protein